MPHPISRPPTLPVCIAYEATAYGTLVGKSTTSAPAPATPRPLRLSGMSVNPALPSVQSDPAA
ncbi:hypothetical protein [Streptomyces phaeochromogenes]|uniref:hypothetical protein n=1 Tax=Streptomyces phaeochromogenes TaxID=1923 RepID=UPI003718B084